MALARGFCVLTRGGSSVARRFSSGSVLSSWPPGSLPRQFAPLKARPAAAAAAARVDSLFGGASPTRAAASASPLDTAHDVALFGVANCPSLHELLPLPSRGRLPTAPWDAPPLAEQERDIDGAGGAACEVEDAPSPRSTNEPLLAIKRTFQVNRRPLRGAGPPALSHPLSASAARSLC